MTITFAAAKKLFDEKKYQQALQAYEELGKLYGPNVVEYNIQLCEKQLSDVNLMTEKNAVMNKNNLQTIEENKTELSFEGMQNITKQVEDKYAEIKNLSIIISGKKSVEEFDSLLIYADELRKIGMIDTYVKLIKYLLLQYRFLNDKNKKNIVNHISTALRLSKDDDIKNLLYEKHLCLIKDLNLSPKYKDSLFGLNCVQKYDYWDKKRWLAFDKQSEPRSFVTDLLFDQDANKILSDNPEYYLVLSNNFTKDPVLYRTFVNKYLSTKQLETVKSVETDTDNVLKKIAFESLTSSCSNSSELVSIIVSAYNSEATVEYAISSLLKQTYSNLEILVCDDCSIDNTFQVIKKIALKDSRVKVFQSGENQGTYNIRNNLIKKANGKYITFHDSDDYAFPTRIEQQVRALQDTDCFLCTTEFIRISPTGEFIFFHDDLASRFCVVSSMIRKDIMNTLPPFRSALIGADTEFYEQFIASYGHRRIINIKKPLIFGLWGGSSLTKLPNLQAEHTGFIAKRRRLYSDIVARQRALGTKIVTHADVTKILQECEIYRQDKGVKFGGLR